MTALLTAAALERSGESQCDSPSSSIRERHHRLREAFGEVHRAMLVRTRVRVAAVEHRTPANRRAERALELGRSGAESDEQLLSRYHAGDMAAFERLYRRYARKAHTLARNLTRDSDDAREIVQEAFIRVIRGSKQFAGQCAFYTWLYRIVFNLSVDHNRRAIPQRTNLEDVTALAVDVTTLSTCSVRAWDPYENCATMEAYEGLSLALDCLSEIHRRTLVMRELYGMSYSEMARLQGCSKGTVMSRLFHARQRIHQALATLRHPRAR